MTIVRTTATTATETESTIEVGKDLATMKATVSEAPTFPAVSYA